MPDIQMRFHRDMLVLSAPMDYSLEKQGVDLERDMEYMSMIEPESFSDFYSLERVAGAVCLVARTGELTQARLAHNRLQDRSEELVGIAIEAASALKPQHLICEVASCQLPLDENNATSVKQTLAQYAQLARCISPYNPDAILIQAQRGALDCSLALQAVKEQFSGPVMVCVHLSQEQEALGVFPDEYLKACSQAQVLGFESGADPAVMCAIAQDLASKTQLPILVQIRVRQATALEKRQASLGAPVPTNPYPLPDSLAQLALDLRARGVQFLRAAGQATSAYTGVLSAVTDKLDCVR